MVQLKGPDKGPVKKHSYGFGERTPSTSDALEGHELADDWFSSLLNEFNKIPAIAGTRSRNSSPPPAPLDSGLGTSVESRPAYWPLLTPPEKAPCRTPCRFFARPSGCRAGERCPFAHLSASRASGASESWIGLEDEMARCGARVLTVDRFSNLPHLHYAGGAPGEKERALSVPSGVAYSVLLASLNSELNSELSGSSGEKVVGVAFEDNKQVIRQQGARCRGERKPIQTLSGTA